eukprot:959823_1
MSGILSARFIVTLVFGIIIPLAFGQQQSCFQAYECANQSTSEADQMSMVMNNGYKSHYAFGIYTLGVWCGGSLSCHQVSNIQVHTTNPSASVIASGANAISYSLCLMLRIA